MARTFHIVVAADRNMGIGKDGGLPWKLPGDMAYFKRLTSEVSDDGKRNAVIMGRKTWLSIPPKFRPLTNRLNVILTRDPASVAVGASRQDVITAATLDQALSLCDRPDIENVFVIGGGAVYTEALRHPSCDIVYLTCIDAEYSCDTFLPQLQADFVRDNAAEPQVHEDGGVQYTFQKFRNKKFLSLASRDK